MILNTYSSTYVYNLLYLGIRVTLFTIKLQNIAFIKIITDNRKQLIKELKKIKKLKTIFYHVACI